jgi:hypothetical protein
MNPDSAHPEWDCPGQERWRSDRSCSGTVSDPGPRLLPITFWQPLGHPNSIPGIHAARLRPFLPGSSDRCSGGSILSEHNWEEFPIDDPILAKMKVCSARFSGPYLRYWVWRPTWLCQFGGGCWRPSPLATFPGGSPTAATGSNRYPRARHLLVIRPSVLRPTNRVLGSRYGHRRPAHRAGICTSGAGSSNCAILPPRCGRK